MSEEQLLPCPFCGGKAILRGHQAPEFWVACNGMGCKASTEAFGSKSKAITAWNTRATPNNTAASDLVKRLAELQLAAFLAGRGSVITKTAGQTVEAKRAPTMDDFRRMALSALPTEVSELVGMPTWEDQIKCAYETGATDVHNAWVLGNGQREADFAEAASDYLASLDLRRVAAKLSNERRTSHE